MTIQGIIEREIECCRLTAVLVIKLAGTILLPGKDTWWGDRIEAFLWLGVIVALGIVGANIANGYYAGNLLAQSLGVFLFPHILLRVFIWDGVRLADPRQH